MKKIIFLILFFNLHSFGQKYDDLDLYWSYSPFNGKGSENTYAIKSKVLPYTIGNGLGINNSLGFEIGFFKNNSIGVEGYYNYSQNSHDKVTDKSGVYHETGNRSYGNEKALQFNYRYYFNFQKLRDRKRKAFYSGLFYRVENDLSRNDENFINDYINQTTNSKAYGIIIGMISRFKNSKHFGMDYNFSFGNEYNTITGLNESYEATYRKSKSNYFNIGISLNYWFNYSPVKKPTTYGPQP